MFIKIAVVDDHEIFRLGLCGLLELINGFSICGLYSNGKEFLESIENITPDIVLMDIKMPVMDGEDATKKALGKYPLLKIIALSLYSENKYYQKMNAAGVKGFVLKESSKEELERAIREVHKGKTYFSQELIQHMISNLKLYPKEYRNHSLKELTKRELALINNICLGLSNNEIATKLYVSIKTVESNKTKLFNKFGVRNSIELVIYAAKNNLVDI